jgi:hypothetical protein
LEKLGGNNPSDFCRKKFKKREGKTGWGFSYSSTVTALVVVRENTVGKETGKPGIDSSARSAWHSGGADGLLNLS